MLNPRKQRISFGFYRDRRGVVAIILAVMLVPIILAVGVAVDSSRLIRYQTELQDAVDSAALSGATLYGTDDAALVSPSYSARNTAINSATRQMQASKSHFDSDVSIGAIAITGGEDVSAAGFPYRNWIKVSATATVKLTILSMFKSPTIAAKAEAINPFTFAIITPSTVLPSTSAQDWNSVWVYPVQMTGNAAVNILPGYPTFNIMPEMTKDAVLNSGCANENCGEVIVDNCNFATGGTPQCATPTAEDGPTAIHGASNMLGAGTTYNPPPNPPQPLSPILISSTQPLGYVLKNVTGFLSSKDGYTNAYGAPNGSVNIFGTAAYVGGQPPSYETDQYYSTANYGVNWVAEPANNPASYPTVNNCSIIVGEDLANPTMSPYSGQCFDVNDPRAGYEKASLTCAQMGTHVFTHFWNDMGGLSSTAYAPGASASHDDLDYNDLVYSVSCRRYAPTQSLQPILIPFIP